MIEHLDLLMFAFACIILILGYPVAFSLAGSAILSRILVIILMFSPCSL